MQHSSSYTILDKPEPSGVDDPTLGENEEWYRKLDKDAFKKDVDDLRKTLEALQGPEDMTHLKRIVFVTNMLRYIGYGFMWLPWYYGFHILSLSTAIFAEFSIINHAIIHRGYDYAKHEKFNSKTFTDDSLWGRWKSWSLEIFLPSGWSYSHGHSHHYKLNELTDPDLVERNLTFLREMKAPFWLKRIFAFVLAVSWKYLYYASNQLKSLSMHKLMVNDREAYDTIPTKVKNAPFNLPTYIMKYRPWMISLLPVMGPYYMWHFVSIPLFFYSIGWASFARVLFNMVLMELSTNLHAFIAIVPNHAGLDMYKFSTPTEVRSGDFYVRQIIGSADYTTSGNITDYLLGWLNFQATHHCFPDQSNLSYQKGTPLLKAICKKHGVPYTCEPIWTRVNKTVDIMIGKTSMKQFN